jgi:hypothetical protein
MLPLLLALVANVQPAFTPPPAPPGPSRPGTQAFRIERDAYAATLRSNCVSEPGIAILIESWERNRAAAIASVPEGRAVAQELAEAALTMPIDMDRLERALAADHRFQQERAAERLGDRIATLRALSPADRILYGRRLTAMQPRTPARLCSSLPPSRR